MAPYPRHTDPGCTCYHCSGKLAPQRANAEKVAAVRRSLIRAGFVASKIRLGNTFQLIWHEPKAPLDLEREREQSAGRLADTLVNKK